MTPFRELDPLLHSQLRLAIMSVLISVDSADFNYLREKTGATAGNLSVQIGKLKDAGYISVSKSFGESYPQTMCRITELGRKKFAGYVAALKDYLGPEA
jgi:DNA-binding MarR family transcriptional regulator